MEVTLSSWLTKWILGFEQTAEVISPPELKQKLIEAAQRILAVYIEKKRAA